MVARTATLRRIEIALDALDAALDDLPEVAEEWQELADGERASWSLDWDHLMGTYLITLDRYKRHGDMTAEQISRYRALLTRLREALPVIDSLSLYRPPIRLD